MLHNNNKITERNNILLKQFYNNKETYKNKPLLGLQIITHKFETMYLI